MDIRIAQFGPSDGWAWKYWWNTVVQVTTVENGKDRDLDEKWIIKEGKLKRFTENLWVNIDEMGDKGKAFLSDFRQRA